MERIFEVFPILQERRNLRGVAQEIHHTGIGILLVEHNARMALKLASQGFVLQTGEIIRKGEAKDLAEDEYLKQR